MSGRPVTVVGMGEDGIAGLGAAARAALEEAEILIGSPRLLEMIPGSRAERHAWPSPFDPMTERLEQWRNRRTVVVATGDPLWFGAAASLARRLPPGRLEVIPAPSAFQLAAARMCWPLQDVETVSLHGRSVALVEPLVQPGARIIALAEGDRTVREVAERLCRRGFGGSAITVLERMGGAAERRSGFAADAVPAGPFDALLTLAVECRGGPGAQVLPATGLPDDAFAHDGQITKREVRAITLAALGPYPGGLLWDVGAGCGSVSIEWTRAARNASALAFERNADRCRMIAGNVDQLGAVALTVAEGDVPSTLTGQPAPDAVFIGGAVADPAVFEACWSALRPGGRLVANAVTLEAEAHLIGLQARHGGDMVRIDISTLDTIGGMHALRPRLPVLQWRVAKPW